MRVRAWGHEQIPGFGDGVRMPKTGAGQLSGGGMFKEQRENSDVGEARGTEHIFNTETESERSCQEEVSVLLSTKISRNVPIKTD